MPYGFELKQAASSRGRSRKHTEKIKDLLSQQVCHTLEVGIRDLRELEKTIRRDIELQVPRKAIQAAIDLWELVKGETVDTYNDMNDYVTQEVADKYAGIWATLMADAAILEQDAQDYRDMAPDVEGTHPPAHTEGTPSTHAPLQEDDAVKPDPDAPPPSLEQEQEIEALRQKTLQYEEEIQRLEKQLMDSIAASRSRVKVSQEGKAIPKAGHEAGENPIKEENSPSHSPEQKPARMFQPVRLKTGSPQLDPQGPHAPLHSAPAVAPIAPPAVSTPAEPQCSLTSPGISEIARLADPSVAQMEVSRALLSTLDKIVDKLNDGDAARHLPTIQPGIYNGDPFKFPAWWSSFKVMIERRARDNFDRLHYLYNYTEGDARDCVEWYMTSDDPETAYERAKSAFLDRFGSPIMIAQAFKSKLASWSQIRDGDARGLQRFSDFLWQCYSALNTIRTLADLDTQEENVKLVRKLPRHLATRWNREVTMAQYKRDPERPGPASYVGNYPKFFRFCQFVSDEARVLGGPCQPRQAQEHQPSGRDGRAARTLNTGTRPRTFSSAPRGGTASRPEIEPKCAYCARKHWVQDCIEFTRKPKQEKKDFAIKNNMCFGCLRTNHRWSECTKRNPGLMSDPEPPLAEAARSCRTEVAIAEHYCMMLPVWVFVGDNPEEKQLVYALIDSQSDSSFLLEEVADRLKVRGTPLELDLTTMDGTKKVHARRLDGIRVQGELEKEQLSFERVYTATDIPGSHDCLPTRKLVADTPHLRRLRDRIRDPRPEIPIGLLIGWDCALAMVPEDKAVAPRSKIFGYKSPLGWMILGPHVERSDEPASRKVRTLRTQVKEVSYDSFRRAFDQDFHEEPGDHRKLSADDQAFMDFVHKKARQRDDGHWVIPLPFRGGKPPEDAPDSRPEAVARLRSQQRKMLKDHAYAEKYVTFMKNMRTRGHSQRVKLPDRVPINKRWYWSHHGIESEAKPDEVRGVFDGSAKIKGISINDLLLQGPDLTNNLVGVLCRFREDPVPVTCDVEKMFFQVFLPEEPIEEPGDLDPEEIPCDRDFMRFVWFKDDDYVKGEVEDYRMCVHLFGAKSSPGCANFALQETARRHGNKFSPEAASFVKDSFYVDDGLGSQPNAEKATRLMQESHSLCQEGGFNLHKYTCGDPHALKKLDKELVAKHLRDINPDQDEMPVSRALGVLISLADDAFRYRVKKVEREATRRGCLSILSSVYDPLGFVGPCLLEGRLILQELCGQGWDWDEKLEEAMVMRWNAWLDGLSGLAEVSVPRCVRRTVGLPVTEALLHVCCDSSSYGYGAASYLVLKDGDNHVDSSLMLAKSRVGPSKPTTIPRGELQAAVLGVKMGNFLAQELRYEGLIIHYWTDSLIVLGYVLNGQRRYHIYVRNRAHFIRTHSEVKNWHHIRSENNPADIASRGATPQELVESSLWWNGPPDMFSLNELPETTPTMEDPDDPEVKRPVAVKLTLKKEEPWLLQYARRFSGWEKLVGVVAIFLKFAKVTIERRRTKGLPKIPLAQFMVPAREVILRTTQVFHLEEEWNALRGREYPTSPASVRERRRALPRNSIAKLDPFVDDSGCIRVGGRIKRADLPKDIKHPILVPKKSHVTSLLVGHFHRKVNHTGSGMTLNRLRQDGLWVVQGRRAVQSEIRMCVICRRIRGPLARQKMADLPRDRFAMVAAFTYAAVDVFGHFTVRLGRARAKRWICIFVCLSIRAVHMEVLHSLDTSSFLNAFRRFVGRRGPVRHLRCDRGTNFIGGRNETQAAELEVDYDQVERSLASAGCEMVEFKFNAPHASHMGGIWERQIRSVRGALAHTIAQNEERMNDEILYTVVVEAEVIVNGRPLSYLDQSDPTSLAPLTPAQLLTFKAEPVLALPGKFEESDRYARKRWRAVQYMAEQFWLRWRSEVLPELQGRQKWQQAVPNLKEGDVVLVHEPNAPRMSWPMGRVVATTAGEDGLVRRVSVKTSSGTYERPIHKLVFLMDTGESSDEPRADQE